MRMWTGPITLAAILGLVAASPPALAVELTGTIKGTVIDEDDIGVPNAAVEIQSEALMGEFTTLTDAEGRFRFSGLPPGDYTVMIAPVGSALRPWESATIKVRQGSSLQVEAVLQAKTADEEITVYGDAPVVDVESTETGVVLDAEFLRDVPNGRDYLSAISVSPGVVGGGNVNAGGAFDTSNQFYVDGVNTTDPLLNTFSTNLNYEAIESIQIMTGGMDAEYGRSLGAAVNVVTKSGGNDFEGLALMEYSDDKMVLAKPLEGDSDDSFLEEQLVLNLGGPILKDKVWFFTSFQGDRSIRATSIDFEEIGRDPELYPMEDRNWRSFYLMGKVTAQPVPAHRLHLMLNTERTRIDNVEQNAYTLPSGELSVDQGGFLITLGHLFTPTSSLQVNSQLYYQGSYLDYFPTMWRDCQSFDEDGVCEDTFGDVDGDGIDDDHGFFGYGAGDFSYGAYPYAGYSRRPRMSANTKATLFGDLLGEHEVSIGAQFEWLTAFQQYPGIDKARGGYEFWTNTGDPADIGSYEPALKVAYDNDLESNLTGSLTSWYVQDVYKPHSRLTIRPGLRFDHANMRNELKESVYSSLVVAPRLGVAYDLSGSGRTSLWGHYGRFFDSGFLIIADLLRARSQGLAGYGWDADTEDWSPNPSWTVADSFLALDDINNPYQDAYQVGISHQVGPTWGVSGAFIYKESHRFWEDDEVNLIWDEDGTGVIGYRNGVNEAIYRLRTPDESFTQYTSVQLSFTKLYSDNWAMLGSYTWSHAYGTQSGDQATGALDIPEQRQYEVGLLDHDVPHYLKLQGSYRDPDLYQIGALEGGWLVGWDFFMRSGYPYNKVVWNDYYEGYSNYIEPQDGRYRLEAVANMDLRAGLLFTVGRARWDLTGTVYNLFNSRAITSVNQEYDPEALAEDQTFGQVLDRQRSRRLQIMLRGEF